MKKRDLSVSEHLEEFKRSRHYDKIIRFTSDVQKGDLVLGKLITYGYIIHGQTKSGSTATAHILCGNPLKGVTIGGQNMVQATTSRHRTAAIGNSLGSQTGIPNLFEVKRSYQSDRQYQSNRSETFIIDTPGYNSTHGVLAILANAHLNYRVYKKVQCMKFILCFDHVHVLNTCQKFIDTIMQWSSWFKNYFRDREQIWRSCVFLFTKVEQSEGGEQHTTKMLKDRLIWIIEHLKTTYSHQTEEALKDFIRYIVQEDKILYIKRVKRGESAENINLLKKIEIKTKSWWGREVIYEKNQVDMSQMSFCISKQIIISTTQSEIYQQQFAELIRYYNYRIREFCEAVSQITGKCSLPYILHELTKDAMGSPESHQFLDTMRKYIEKYYPNLDPDYKEDRQKREKELFHTEILTSKTKKYKKKYQDYVVDYLLKKFDALKQIQKLKKYINDADFTERNLPWLEQAQKTLQNIIKVFNKVSYNRRNSTEVIYKYGYLIDLIIEEAKMLFIFIELSSSLKDQIKIRQAADNNCIELFGFLKDSMGPGYIYNNNDQLNADSLQIEYIRKFNIDDPINSNLVLNEQLINFFTEIYLPDDQIIIAIVKIVLKYSDQILSKKQIQLFLRDKNLLISRLTLSRVNCETAFIISVSKQDKQTNLFLIRNITKNLGKMLEMVGKYKLARQVYDSCNFVDNVCKMYEIQLECLKNINEPESHKRAFEMRLDYANYLVKVHRDSHAMQILQEAFEMASTMDDIQKVNRQIQNLRCGLRQNMRWNINNQENQDAFKPLSNESQKQILHEAENIEYES